MSLDQLPSRPLWRSLEELEGSDEFRAWAGNEFPEGTMDAPDGVTRRNVLKLAAASFVLATISGCRQPEEDLLPNVHHPKDRIPGRPEFFASTVVRNGEALGVLVTSHDGRPTKIEGNPKHPASLGATDSYAQVAALQLCDPERSQAVYKAQDNYTWEQLRPQMLDRLKDASKVRLLTGPVVSPTTIDLIDQFLKKNPGAQWHVHDPVAGNAPSQAVYDLTQAKVVVSFDNDFVRNVRSAREWADGRRVLATLSDMNRLYVVEPSPTMTGAHADHRRVAKPSQIQELIAQLAGILGVGPKVEKQDKWLEVAADDLQKNAGKSLVLAGPGLSAEAQAMVLAINAKLGNVGKAVRYAEIATPAKTDIRPLIDDINAGKVATLFIIDSNPCYNVPGFRDLLKKVEFSVHVGLYRDETGVLTTWHAPLAHSLESWGDAIAYDGTVSIIQPLIAPLYQGRTAMHLIAYLAGVDLKTDYELLVAYWRGQRSGAEFDVWWEKTRRDGIMPDVNFNKAITPKVEFPSKVETKAGKFEAIFRTSASTFDGSYSNNAALQELPDPITKLTWDNAVWISKKTADANKIETGTILKLTRNGVTIQAPAMIVPGQADDTLTLPLGYGRTEGGTIGKDVGFNAYTLRSADAMWTAYDITLEVTDKFKHEFAITQEHSQMLGRGFVRTLPVEKYNDPGHKKHSLPLLSLYNDEHKSNFLRAKQQWGMSIDLTTCIGCHACTIACQTENNIPSVGKAQVIVNRELHWIRIDRYFEGSAEEPTIHHQPVPCMQCENAPCEIVCPVGATVHSEDGLNDMVYNRCIGTRYCSNNCPYKVRRFNFYQYADKDTEVVKISRNPEVTIRARGVMEKCTYCTQRIRNAEIDMQVAYQNDPAHKNKVEMVPDGVIKTACEQVCPTGAIVFGDVNDPNSRISKLKAQKHDYSLLEELNTRPRTTYLSSVKNPRKELKAPETEKPGHAAPAAPHHSAIPAVDSRAEVKA